MPRPGAGAGILLSSSIQGGRVDTAELAAPSLRWSALMIVRGQIDLDEAAGSLAARAVLLPEAPANWRQHVEAWRRLLGASLERLRTARVKVEVVIAREIGPMIGVLIASEDLLARSQAANGAHRRLLDGADVLAAVGREVKWRTKRGRR